MGIACPAPARHMSLRRPPPCRSPVSCFLSVAAAAAAVPHGHQRFTAVLPDTPALLAPHLPSSPLTSSPPPQLLTSLTSPSPPPHLLLPPQAMGRLGPVTLDLSLARGLDYYTGVIYEAVLQVGGAGRGGEAGGGWVGGGVGGWVGGWGGGWGFAKMVQDSRRRGALIDDRRRPLVQRQSSPRRPRLCWLYLLLDVVLRWWVVGS